jgi:hypothetical protein
MNALRGLSLGTDAPARYVNVIDGRVLLVRHSYGETFIVGSTEEHGPGLQFAFSWTRAKVTQASRSPSDGLYWFRRQCRALKIRPARPATRTRSSRSEEFQRTFWADLPDDLAAVMAAEAAPAKRRRLHRTRPGRPLEVVAVPVRSLTTRQRHFARGRTVHGQEHEGGVEKQETALMLRSSPGQMLPPRSSSTGMASASPSAEFRSIRREKPCR